MTSVVKEVVNSQRESDKMFLEMEEKRMKYEAQQRKEGTWFSPTDDVHAIWLSEYSHNTRAVWPVSPFFQHSQLL